MKFKKLFSVTFLICLIFSIGFVSVGCTASADKYKPVYKYTNESGKEIYEWPAGGETGMIDVPGGKVNYRAYGMDKKGTPLICVHGGPGGNYSCFYKQLPIAEDRPIIMYDQLGCPLSEIDVSYDTVEKVKSLYTIDRYTDELDAVIKYFNLNEYILYGTSWGCMLSLEYVGKYHPAGLKGMVFSGPFLDVDL